MTARHQENCDWFPWELKRERPTKTLGCQDTSLLPTLEDGQSTCGDDQHCSYFSCGKCSSFLALDVHNSRYKNVLEYIPRIPNIKAPDPLVKNAQDHLYYGEVFEIYFKFFAQIEELTGLAINGWQNGDAQKIFNGVLKTFSGTKFPKTQGFEIDWILFNGWTITAIEVAVRAEKSKSCQHFETKVQQLEKDQIIMQHLLEATGCSHVKVNYVIACPNVSIREITEGACLKNKETIFQSITSNGNGLGFISEESISRKSLYVYERNKKTVIEQPFVEFVNQTNEQNGDQASKHWGDAYKLAASSVVISKLLIGKPKTGCEIRPLTAKNGPNGTEKYAQLAVTSSGQTHAKRETPAKELPTVPGLPDELRKHFPYFLLLGPEQAEVILSKSNRIIIKGEPGTGKTAVLLAILFIHTAKWRSDSSPERKKVLIVVDERKTEFRNFVSDFIEKYCDKTYAILVDSYNKEIYLHDDVAIILVDECSSHQAQVFDSHDAVSPEVQIVCALTSVVLVRSRTGVTFTSKWKIFHFKNSYRCPTNIALRYTKIKRLINHAYFDQNPIVPLLKSAQYFIDDKSDIKLMKYTKEIQECELPKKQFDGESLLIVVIDFDNTNYKVDTSFAKNFDHCCIYRATTEEYSKIDSHWDVLPFTGVQYHTVVIIVGALIHLSRIDDIAPFILYLAFNEIMYHAVSRALRRVILFYQEESNRFIREILSLDNLDLDVFMKLKSGTEMSEEDFDLIKMDEDFTEALDIIITTENNKQLRALMQYIRVHKRGYFFERTVAEVFAKHLGHLGEDELVKIFSAVLPEDDNLSIFLSFYLSTAHLLAPPSLALKMQKVLPILEPYRANWNQLVAKEANRENYKHFMRLMTASAIWRDSETFSTIILEYKTLLHTIIDKVGQLLNEKPNYLKCQFQPFYEEDAWVRIQEETEKECFEPFNSLIEIEHNVVIRATMMNGLANAARNVFDCSTCSSLVESAIHKIIQLFDETSGRPLDEILSEIIDQLPGGNEEQRRKRRIITEKYYNMDKLVAEALREEMEKAMEIAREEAFEETMKKAIEEAMEKEMDEAVEQETEEAMEKAMEKTMKKALGKAIEQIRKKEEMSEEERIMMTRKQRNAEMNLVTTMASQACHGSDRLVDKLFAEALREEIEKVMEKAMEKAFEETMKKAIEEAMEKAMDEAVEEETEEAMEKAMEKTMEKAFEEALEQIWKKKEMNEEERIMMTRKMGEAEMDLVTIMASQACHVFDRLVHKLVAEALEEVNRICEEIRTIEEEDTNEVEMSEEEDMSQEEMKEIMNRICEDMNEKDTSEEEMKEEERMKRKRKKTNEKLSEVEKRMKKEKQKRKKENMKERERMKSKRKKKTDEETSEEEKRMERDKRKKVQEKNERESMNREKKKRKKEEEKERERLKSKRKKKTDEEMSEEEKKWREITRRRKYRKKMKEKV